MSQVFYGGRGGGKTSAQARASFKMGDAINIRENGKTERVTFDNYDNCGTTAWVRLADGSMHEVALDALGPIMSQKTFG